MEEGVTHRSPHVPISAPLTLTHPSFHRPQRRALREGWHAPGTSTRPPARTARPPQLP